MKKNLLMILLAIPFIYINVFADAPVARAVDVVDNPNAKTEFLAEASKWNVSPFNKSGYYVEVLEATCNSSVNSITLLNSDVKSVLACENGTPIELSDGRAYFIKSDIQNLHDIFSDLEADTE